MASDDDLHKDALEAFRLAEEAESENRIAGRDDIIFARQGVQWPENIRKQREEDGRPCLTINKLPTFVRQVVNDARQSKPSIKVHPVDSGADVETAKVIDGLIRNIEYSSNADVAYDTATECAVGNGFGYIRVGLGYAYDDTFDQDITIDRVLNPFSVYGDPNSTAADSSDWDSAFVVDRLSKKQFEREYGKDQSDAVANWNEADAWQGVPWAEGDTYMVAEWWVREKVDRTIVKLSTGLVVGAEDLKTDPDLQALMETGVVQVVGERVTKACKVKQHFLSGAGILYRKDGSEKGRGWPGRYIPIIPVYGDEFDVQGKRYFRSLIHPAIDAQRMFNYWRTTSTELVALAPRVPYIGPEGAFAVDPDKWATANTKSHPYLEYAKNSPAPPQRQPLESGPAAGALQEALNASDDMKAIVGLYDASLGARSNETSGRAIMARQREGDTSTFHFIDNMARAIRHTGRVIIDLIPHVYNTERVIRVIGEDGKEEARQINAPYPQKDPQTGAPVTDETGQAVMAMHDLRTGKYDITVTTGPSFTTRREEAAFSMTEALRAFPQAASVIVPELAKNLDWPGADEIAEKLEKQASGQLPPEVQQVIEQGKQEIAKLTEENQQLKQDHSLDEAKLQADIQQANVEAANKVKIALIDIEAEKQIAFAKIEAQKEIDAFKATVMAQAQASRPQPENRNAA